MASKKSRLIAVFLSVLLCAAACAPVFAAVGCERGAEQILAGMSTEDKICQMLMICFGTATDAGGHRVLSAQAADSLSRHAFGGVMLFGQDLAVTVDSVRLIDAIQTANASGNGERTQLFTACDQEGGTVTRLGQGTQTPGNMALGAIGDTDAARRAGGIIGSELEAIGINIDLAPVVDVNSNPRNPVIGVRSFSDDAGAAARLGGGYMRGLSSANTIACLKHFPGHGDTSTDSHTGLPVLNRSYEQLLARELVPFRACINQGAEMIMIAHISFPKLESGSYTSPVTGKTLTLPASLSERVITDILRGDLGFGGVVITDAMEMDAIANNFGPAEAARLAINAGEDIILSPVTPIGSSGFARLERYISELTEMAENGEIRMDRVDAAVLRILRLKQRRGLLGRYNSGGLSSRIANAQRIVGSPANHAEEWTLTKRAITLVRNERNALPITGGSKRSVVLINNEDERLSIQYAIDLLRSEGKLPSSLEVDIVCVNGRSYSSIAGSIGSADNVIALSRLRSVSGLKSDHAALIDRLIGCVHGYGGRFIVLSTLLPYDCARFQAADAVMLAYSASTMSEDPRVDHDGVTQYGPNIPAAIYLMFSADGSPAGKLPVNVYALDQGHDLTDTMLYKRGFGLSYSSSSAPTAEPSASPSPSETPQPTSTPACEPTGGAQPTAGETEIPNETASALPEPDETVSAAPVTEGPLPTAWESGIASETPDDGGSGERTGAWVRPFVIAAAAVMLIATAALIIRKNRR